MDDLISEFIAETSESLAALDTELVTLEQNPDDEELIGNIFRLVHTIKGTCGFLGLPRLEAVAHAGENVLGRIRDKELAVTPEAVSFILQAFDCIKDIVEHLEAEGSEPEGNDAELIAKLNAHAGMTDHGDDPLATVVADVEAEEALSDEEIAAAMMADAESGNSDVTPYTEPTLDDLERAWLEAEGPDDEPEAPPPEEPAASEDTHTLPTPPAPALSDTAKKQAVQDGLKVDVPDKPKKPPTQSIRVNLDVLEDLMQMVSELVLTRNQLMQVARQRTENDLLTPLQQLNHITSELQEGVMKTRMQPISNAWAKFPRLVRDLSMELGKKIDLEMEGEDTELDRQILDMIKDPLTHMVRNSVDHGMDTPDERTAAGKDPTGTVLLRAYHESGHIVIEIRDNGRGVNIPRVSEKAIENGLATAEQIAQMSEQQICKFIFQAGFSTAEAVTNVSGRGVGMDVVRSNIEKIGGAIDLQSKTGEGSVFYIKIPLTLAIVSVLVVESAGQRFAIPQINVEELVYASPKSEYSIEMINDTPVMRLREKLLPLISLKTILGIEEPDEETERNITTNNTFVAVCNVGGYHFGVMVDRVFDTEEIVVKPVSPILAHIDIYAGTTILGDGSVIMILDANGLAKRTGDQHTTEAQQKNNQNTLPAYDQQELGFLLFSLEGDTTPKAVPLDLVSRLEEIDPKKVERSSRHRVVQYRDNLMRLISLNDNYDPNEDGLLSVIVFEYEGKSLGLVVKDIVDIVRARLDLKMASDDKNYIGSAVLNNATTDIIDAGALMGELLNDIATTEDTEEDGQDTPNRPRVIIVDDSAFFRNLTAPFLSVSGIDVVSLDNAASALAMLQESPHAFSAVISDIEMPDMDGCELAQAIKADSSINHLPLIAITSNMRRSAIARGLEAGFHAYVSKTDREGMLRELQAALISNEDQTFAALEGA